MAAFDKQVVKAPALEDIVELEHWNFLILRPNEKSFE